MNSNSNILKLHADTKLHMHEYTHAFAQNRVKTHNHHLKEKKMQRKVCVFIGW